MTELEKETIVACARASIYWDSCCAVGLVDSVTRQERVKVLKIIYNCPKLDGGEE